MTIEGARHTYLGRMEPPFPRRLFPKIRITVHPFELIAMPEARTGKERRRIASNRMRVMLEEQYCRSRLPTTIHEAFLDAVKLYGRKAVVVDDIRQISMTGERMPAKSTYFYPKLLSGLLINPLD